MTNSKTYSLYTAEERYNDERELDLISSIKMRDEDLLYAADQAVYVCENELKNAIVIAHEAREQLDSAIAIEKHAENQLNFAHDAFNAARKQSSIDVLIECRDKSVNAFSNWIVAACLCETTKQSCEMFDKCAIQAQMRFDRELQKQLDIQKEYQQSTINYENAYKKYIDKYSEYTFEYDSDTSSIEVNLNNSPTNESND